MPDTPNNSRGTDSGRGSSGPNSPAPGNPRRPRRRRWLRYVLIFLALAVVGLVVLAIVLPRIVSSQQGTAYLLSFINARLRGQVEARKIDLSWRGPIQVEGLTLLDPQKRTVFTAERVIAHNGLWDIVRSPMTFGNIDVDQPAADLYLQEDQPVSLVEAVEMRDRAAKEAPSEEASKAPSPRGQVTIHGGRIRIVKPDGQELRIADLNGQASLDTLNDLQTDLAAELGSGGTIQAKAHIQNLVNYAGQIDISGATGRFSADTPQPIALDALSSFADQPGITGQGMARVSGSVDQGRLQADFTAGIEGFSAGRRAGATQPARVTPPRLIAMTLTGRVETGGAQTVALANVTGDVGTARARFTYTAASGPVAVSGQDLIDTMLTGRPINLPTITGDLEGDLDLQALAEAVPRFVQVRKDVRIVSGRLHVEDLAIRTKPQPAAIGGIRLVDLRATREGQPIEWQPIVLTFDVQVQPDVGLQVKRGGLESGFATADVQGNPKDFVGRFQADLARLDAQLRQVVDLGDLQLAGDLQGQFHLSKAGTGPLNVTSRITANNLQYASGSRRLSIEQATLGPKGRLILQDNHLQKVILEEAEINIDRQILAGATGEYDFGPARWTADLAIQRAAIPYLLGLARGLGIDALDAYEGYSGQIEDLVVRASWNPQDEVITSSGNGTIRALAVGGQTATDSLAFGWRQAVYTPQSGRAQLDGATIETGFLRLTADAFDLQPGETMTLSGKVNASAQVQPTLAAVYVLSGREQTPNIAGQLQLVGQLQTQGRTIGVAGDATVKDLQVGSGPRTVRQEQVRFAYDAQMDQDADMVTIRRAELTSSPLSARLAGTVKDVRTQQLLSLDGQYSAEWGQVMPIVHELAPGLGETINLQGTSRSPFSIRGLAFQPKVDPVFGGLTMEGPAIGWQSGTVYGLELGAGQIEPRLQDGRLTVPATAIPASGGKINLGAIVDFAGQTPRLQMPNKLQVLDSINLNTQIGKQLLSYVNPLFADVAGMEGKVSLTVQDIDLPLGEQIKRSGTGRGQFDLRNMRVQPAGAFGLLVRIAGATQTRGTRGASRGLGIIEGLDTAAGLLGQHDRQQNQIDPHGTVDIRIGNPTFEIRDGRIHYDNFTLSFANGVDMVFSGWVGFDDTVKMYVGVPVTAGLLEAAGVKGPVAQYASVLGGVRVDVPIVGTRTSSRLDFGRIHTQPLVDQAIRNLAKAGVRQGIRSAMPGAGLLPELLPRNEHRSDQGLPLPGEDILRRIFPSRDDQRQSPPPNPRQEDRSQ